MAKKQKATSILCTQNLAQSIEQGTKLIMAGLVFADFGTHVQRVEKAGDMLDPDIPLIIKGQERFVSRGAYKLLTALEHFHIDVTGFVALDAGASTGGFTDCLLQHGAIRVYAVDVGKNQLHEKLRQDSRVISLEGINLRIAEANLIPEKVDMLVADVSFISLTKILPPCIQWLKKGALIAALIKPQFEVEFGETQKGVVRDEGIRQAAVDKVLDFARDTLQLEFLGIVPSALKGPKGNQEYMAVWRC